MPQQGVVKLALGGTGARGWNQFGASEVSLQEFVREQQPSGSVPIEQMVATSEPEVALSAHGRTPSRSVARSRCSSTSCSAPTISTKSNARDGDCAAGRSERNASWIDPPSILRVTATMTPAG